MVIVYDSDKCRQLQTTAFKFITFTSIRGSFVCKNSFLCVVFTIDV